MIAKYRGYLPKKSEKTKGMKNFQLCIHRHIGYRSIGFGKIKNADESSIGIQLWSITIALDWSNKNSQR